MRMFVMKSVINHTGFILSVISQPNVVTSSFSTHGDWKRWTTRRRCGWRGAFMTGSALSVLIVSRMCLCWLVVIVLSRLELEQGSRRMEQLEVAQCRQQLQLVADENVRLRREVEVCIVSGGTLYSSFVLIIVIWSISVLRLHDIRIKSMLWYGFFSVISVNK